jgi:molecular chaperone GrpE
VPPDHGKFSTEIDPSVIDQALKSVKRHTEGEAPPAATAPSAEEPKLEVETESSSKEVEQLKIQLEFSQAKGRELMEKVKDSHEKMLRAVADLDNFKKRANKEKEEVQRYGNERLLKDLLPVADNLDRALDHAKTGTDLESFQKGVAMTRKAFDDALAKHGVKSFSAVGQAFDPRLHEAMTQVETAEVAAGQVVSEVLRGYTLNERLMRPALVAVAKAPEGAAPAKAEEES